MLIYIKCLGIGSFRSYNLLLFLLLCRMYLIGSLSNLLPFNKTNKKHMEWYLMKNKLKVGMKGPWSPWSPEDLGWSGKSGRCRGPEGLEGSDICKVREVRKVQEVQNKGGVLTKYKNLPMTTSKTFSDHFGS